MQPNETQASSRGRGGGGLKKAFRIPTPERAVISRDGTRAAFEVFYGYLGFFNGYALFASR